MPPQLSLQPSRTAFNQIKRAFEVARVIRVGDFGLRPFCVVGEARDRRVIARRAQRLNIGDVVRIHPDNQIKRVEILRGESPRAQV